MSNSKIATAETWYETRPIGDGVTWIFEPHIKEYYRCNMWHVRGRTRDMLVDSGMGVVDLRRHVAILAERPVLAIASHGHFDHVGAHHEFPDRAIHAAEANILTNPDRFNTVAQQYVSDDIFDALPPGDWNAERYDVRPAAPTLLLVEGSVIDLGDRHFEVLHLPGHSPGSIALYEKSSETLFSGDVIYDGPLAWEVYHSVLPTYVESMKRLAELPVRIVHGGHFPSFGRARMLAIIRDFLAANDR